MPAPAERDTSAINGDESRNRDTGEEEKVPVLLGADLRTGLRGQQRWNSRLCVCHVFFGVRTEELGGEQTGRGQATENVGGLRLEAVDKQCLKPRSSSRGGWWWKGGGGGWQG